MSTQQAFNTHIPDPDVILVGSGIMAATLGAMLKILSPSITIQIYEVTNEPAQESSNGWNNAGTGHAGLCELSYTPHMRPDGTVDVTKAIGVFEDFELSRQFWAYAVQRGILPFPKAFVRPVPHLSFVHGAANVAYLKARYQALKDHPFFQDMEYTSNPEAIAQWAPLLMQGRDPNEPVAATKVDAGTDVNFGALSRGLIQWLSTQPGCGIATGHRVRDITREAQGWQVHVENTHTNITTNNQAPFIFIGAGGGSLPLLQQTGIPQSRGIGGFPIGGQWLVCDNPEVIAQHHAKVYGQSPGAAPTMAVPHLDTRVLDNKQLLLFGPFAAWTSKFLHNGGSVLDLPLSVKPHNLLTLINIGIKNLDLIRYLVNQGKQSKEDRMQSLREFYPSAQSDDWRLIDAGIRVQAIKSSEGKSGIVHYGTEVVTNSEKSIAALLGASPGASVSSQIALEVIAKCLPHLLTNNPTLERMVPTYGVDIKSPAHAVFYKEASQKATRILQLQA